MTDQPVLLFTRFVARPRSLAAMIPICVVLILLPFAAAALDGQLSDLFSQGTWRFTLVQPVVIIYILIVAPIMSRIGDDVVQSFRPLVQLDDKSFARLVAEYSAVPLIREIIAILIGAAFGMWWAISNNSEITPSWFFAYWTLANTAMFGLLTWTIYLSFADTRLTAALHRQPLMIDLFDITPFQAVGRQSLAGALVFIGGILVSLILGAATENFRYIEFWLLYIPLALVPVLIFFMSMRPTHHVLSREKKRLQGILISQLHVRILKLESGLEKGGIPAELASELNALSSYEKILQNTRTWPYNTAQMRTLFFSVLLPAITMLLRSVIDNYLK